MERRPPASISGHPIDAYRELSRRLGAAPIGRILEILRRRLDRRSLPTVRS